jgi:hypothetical protein
MTLGCSYRRRLEQLGVATEQGCGLGCIPRDQLGVVEAAHPDPTEPASPLRPVFSNLDPALCEQRKPTGVDREAWAFVSSAESGVLRHPGFSRRAEGPRRTRLEASDPTGPGRTRVATGQTGDRWEAA